MGITEPDLDKRLTEFQVAESADGKFIGAVAMRMAESQGLILHEVFANFALADDVRPLLWERMQAVATNHGLVRIWTREDAPFWSRCGLTPASPEALAKLPESWQVKDARWLVFQRREEIAGTQSVEKEFEMFIQAERQRTQSALEHAKLLKAFATALAVILAMAVIAAAVYLLRKNPILFSP